MKKKYRIKKTAKNEFSKLSGIEATQLSGSIDCLVAHQLRVSPSATATPFTITKSIPIKKFAYALYHNVAISDIKSVKQTCGVAQCVKREHLEAEVENNNKWG